MQPFLPPATPSYATAFPPPLAHGISLSDSVRLVEQHELLHELERDCYVSLDAIWLQQQSVATWKAYADALKKLQNTPPLPGTEVRVGHEEALAQAHAALEKAAEAKTEQTIGLQRNFYRWAETHRQDEQSGRLAAAAMAIVIANAPHAKVPRMSPEARDMNKEKSIRARYLDTIDEARDYFTSRYLSGVEPFSQLETAAAFMATGRFSLAAQQIKKGMDAQDVLTTQDDTQWVSLKTRLSVLQYECEQYACEPLVRSTVPSLPATPPRAEKILQVK